MKKPSGDLCVLDSTCIQPKGTDEVFTQNMFQNLGSSTVLKQVTRAPATNGRRGSQFERVNGFSIKHYAGEVTYDAKVKPQRIECPRNSSNMCFAFRDFWWKTLIAHTPTQPVCLPQVLAISQLLCWPWVLKLGGATPRLPWNSSPPATFSVINSNRWCRRWTQLLHSLFAASSQTKTKKPFLWWASMSDLSWNVEVWLRLCALSSVASQLDAHTKESSANLGKFYRWSILEFDWTPFPCSGLFASAWPRLRPT